MTKPYESVVLPDGPLFLVHRDWATNARRKPSTISVPSTPLPGNIAMQSHFTSATLSATTARSNYTSKTDHEAPQALKFINYTADGRQTQKQCGHKRPQGSSQETTKLHKPSEQDLGNLRTQVIQIPQTEDNLSTTGTSNWEAGFDVSALVQVPKRLLAPYELAVPYSMMGHVPYYVSYYFHAISAILYPLSPFFSFNPAKQNWLPIALTDEAWFYTILYVSASVLAGDTGCHTKFQDAACLLDNALRRLNWRLATGVMPSDETMGAIACLAMLDNSEGNRERSWLHARGLAEMVRMRGGISCVHERLRMKVYRGILEIAVDLDRRPLLPDFYRSRSLLEHEMECSAVETSRPVLSLFPAHPALAGIFQDLFALSQYIERAQTGIDPNAFDEDIFNLQQRLLACNSTDMSEFNSAFRITALLYTKSLTGLIAKLPKTSLGLVWKLRVLLDKFSIPPMPMMLWALFMGGLAALEGTREQEWFLSKIAICALEYLKGNACWAAVRQTLSSILWISTIHDAAGEALWSRV
ncbi:hypothetical protein K469DRAFT_634018 [Zopfia rhizophila CBS 207.26]|uniref:Transcription factor domain-containing protein n=1 Tax=Zopfia rhizophila CBS 207.26 TaxID=1314779 RepID=A0A6A6DXU5_9PEZI|nr:hypothetical protein K469DRAFT_634018 [Zopfia rhizophila CBS 207.26]